MDVIYADELFLINFITDYLILLTTAKVCALRPSRLRMLLGAALGGAYALLAVIFYPRLFSLLPVKLIFGGLTAFIAFWGEARFVRTALCFFAVSAAFGGAVLAVSFLSGRSYSPIVLELKILVPAFCLSYAVISLLFRGSMRLPKGQGAVRVAVELSGRRAVFTGLFDSGNSLRDPISGSRVIVAELSALSPLFSPEILRIIALPGGAVESLGRLAKIDSGVSFRLIPYKSLGNSGSFLLCFRADRVIIGKKSEKGVLVAISPGGLWDGENYRAIIST